jgi:hypothetical protein
MGGLFGILRSRHPAAAAALGALFGLFLSLTIPLVSGARWEITLSVEAIGEKNPASSHAEVWLLAGQWRDGGRQLFAAAVARGAPTNHASFVALQPGGAVSAVSATGRFASDAEIVLFRSGFSGVARVRIGDVERRIDLYSRPDGAETIRLIDLLPPFGHAQFISALQRSVAWTVVAMILGAVLAGGLAAMSSRAGLLTAAQASPGVDVRAEAWLLPALMAPLIVSGALALVAYWPALMTSDSVDQWTQATTGAYNTWHPPLYAMAMRWLRVFADTPAIVAAAQIIGWSFAFSLCLVELRRHGLPIWALVAASVIHAFYPATPWHAVTLWKDIPYTIGLLFLTYGTLVVLRCGAAALRKDAVLLALIGGGLLMVLMRHNGLPVVAVAFLFVAISAGWRSGWKPAAAIFAVVLAMLFVVSRVVYPALGVQRANVAYAAATVPLHLLAAMIQQDGVVPQKDRERLAPLLPKAVVSEHYSCTSFVPIMFDARMDPNRAGAELWFAVRVGLVAMIRNPVIALRHYLCYVSFFLTLDGSPERARINVATSIHQFDLSRQAGLATATLSPSLKASADALHAFTHRPQWQPFFWRTVLPLQLLVLATLIAFLKGISWPGLLLSIAVAHTFATIPLSASPDYRYLLPLVSFGALALSALLADAKDFASAARKHGASMASRRSGDLVA